MTDTDLVGVIKLVKCIMIKQLMSKQSLYLITGNVNLSLMQAKKLEEFKAILGEEFDFKNENVDRIL